MPWWWDKRCFLQTSPRWRHFVNPLLSKLAQICRQTSSAPMLEWCCSSVQLTMYKLKRLPLEFPASPNNLPNDLIHAPLSKSKSFKRAKAAWSILWKRNTWDLPEQHVAPQALNHFDTFIACSTINYFTQGGCARNGSFHIRHHPIR